MQYDPLPLAQRLTRRARDVFVGREDDLARIREILAPDGPLVVYLDGIPGAGKTTLLANFADRVRGDGVTPLLLDCALIEPTERGFLSELGRLTDEAVTSLEDAVAILSKLDGTVILVLDHFETFRLMDTWLRRDFLPAMPDNLRLVVADRRPPVSQWLTSARWHGLVRATTLAPLDRDAALALLASSGLDQDTASSLADVAHGNPLALKLAAAAARARGEMVLRDTAVQDVMQQLTDLFLTDVEDPAVREALQSVSVARRITRSLLRAFSLDDRELFGVLRELTCVDVRRDGLSIQDAVREALARSLKASDPERYHACRRRVWRQLRADLRTAPSADLWRYTADMLYLVENPVVREAFFPSGRSELVVEAAGTDDTEAVAAIARRHDSPGAAALDVWWRHQPDAFRVVRDRDDRVVGFYCMTEARTMPDPLRREDPVASTWARHLEKEPVPDGGRCLFLRRWLSRESGEIPSPEQAACWLDVKRVYMALRPALRRVYLAVADPEPYADVAKKLGFAPLADAAVDIDGAAYATAMLDFGPASVDGWITDLVSDELGVRETDLLVRDRRALDLDGELIPLTPLEYGLLTHLQSLDGATATRDALLEAVWERDAASSSGNVVDAVVKTLRRKLGAEAGRIETVRGFGYRWRLD